jgi:acetyl esterase/lipase
VKLWDDDLEALRPEARQCVAEHREAIRAAFNDRPALARDLDRFARARAVRSSLPQFPPHPAGHERLLAGVPCRVFAPGETPPRAVYVHFHGGGMVLGTPEMNDSANAELARRHDVAVVSVGYRTAPEHPHPAGVDDAVAVTQWVLDHGRDELGAGDLVLGGESAGAYLAVMTLLRLRDAGVDLGRVHGAKLSYGPYDWSRSGGRGQGLLDAGDPAFFRSCYLPDRSDDECRDPAISPRFAELHGLVAALVCVGTDDHLLEDSLVLATRWAAAENAVDLVILPDLPHSFEMYDCGITRACAAAVTAWLDDRFAAVPQAHG